MPSPPEDGHVWAEGRGPAVHFLFEQRKARMPSAVGLSVAAHIGIVLLAVGVARVLPARTFSGDNPEVKNYDIVWLPSPGPGGGGGGGGNKNPEPPREAELPGQDQITVPVTKPVTTEQVTKEEPPEQTQQLSIPAVEMASGITDLPGVLEGLPQASPDSQGAGSGGGAGTGTGTGIGSGSGSGLGAGYGGGTGGGAYRPGNGVELPRVVREVKPQYTADAMRAKVQGTVWIEAVVMPDGSVGKVEVVKSLDRTFGLDEEAVKAARQWRFAPGTRFGQPVPVLVTIELTFTLR